jgi:hypothetical protein
MVLQNIPTPNQDFSRRRGLFAMRSGDRSSQMFYRAATKPKTNLFITIRSCG